LLLAIIATVSWRVAPRLTLAMKIGNVFDENYRELSGFTTRGRNAYTRVILQFLARFVFRRLDSR
jgi:outer membrane cobalamin receptor